MPDTAAKIFVGNEEKTLGFSGGFNNPQLAMGDLNNDGRNDLVVFESGCEWVRTFINYGTPGNPDYRYRPLYAANFPPIKGYIKLVDHNCDAIPDLIHRGATGFSVYTGNYSNNELKFTFFKDLYYSPLQRTIEGFESTIFPPSFGWQVGGTGWSRETVGVNPSVTPYSQAAMLRFNSADLSTGSSALLVSKQLRISPLLGSHAEVSFWMYRDGGSTANDSVAVYIDSVANLTSSSSFLGSVARARTINQPQTEPVDGWYQYSFPIPANIVGDTFFLIFKGTSDGGSNIFIDEIEWIASNINGDVNAFVAHADIPAIADVDNDGDLDFFSYSIAGSYIDFYKNYSVEEGLGCQDIRINLKDACWGKVYQPIERTQHLGISCQQPIDPQKPSKNTHSGNTLCLADTDGDGDYDYFNSNAAYSDIQYFQNGKNDLNSLRDTMISQDTIWQSGGQDLVMDEWPTAYYIDIDDDGDNDLVFTPNTNGHSEDIYCIKWYKNVGNNTLPNLLPENDSLVIKGTIDVGSTSYPMLYDYNKDGKLDLFVGSEGMHRIGANPTSKIEYYENITSGGKIMFRLVDNDFMSLYSQNVYGTSLAVGDIDNDMKDDLIVGHRLGGLSFYKNQAASTTDVPNWQLSEFILKDETGSDINVGTASAPFIYDIDKDGKQDLLIGNNAGHIYYYKNTGSTTGQTKLQLQTSDLGQVKVDRNNATTACSTPFIGRIDNVNKDYLVVGSNSGRLYKYTGFENGDVTTPFKHLDSVYSSINSNLTDYSGYRSAPAFGDIDGDGMYEMILGNAVGGITIWKQSKNVNENVKTKEPLNSNLFSVYPNPAKDQVTISWDEFDFDDEYVTIELLDMTGKVVMSRRVIRKNHSIVFNVNTLTSGIFLCRISSQSTCVINKFTIRN